MKRNLAMRTLAINRLLGKIIGRSERALGHVRALIQLRGCEIAPGACILGAVRLERRGRVRIGEKVIFRDGVAPTSLVCDTGAELSIGANTMLNYGVSLRAARLVRIGRDCLIASFVRIDDSGEGGEAPKPIIIEDNVWVAHGATIFPGVRIGEGSVVSAGSVVTRDVPPNSMAIGDPARCISLNLVGQTQQSAPQKPPASPPALSPEKQTGAKS